MEQAKQYVQHISGQGEKWEVVPCPNFPDVWKVLAAKGRDGALYLPKSEYVPVEPPERWVDVTEECHTTENWPSEMSSKANGIALENNNMLWIPCEQWCKGYRLRKIELEPYHKNCAFIVEKRES